MFTKTKIESRAVELKVNSEAMKGSMILNNWAAKQIQFNVDNIKQSI